ncbi:hypothetical protein NDI85_20080 [Halomicroarcula sp. S1AR25-4]|uniref:hypothetical protein n=1 Tax=Haloarcula sp. S1AR25-4 TaxID=2950538 RepID=UPI002876C65E|nr:hypothetical protein [Halomicroarcula sp. S1AR25-4]MDS0280088.1 hypothetical protein [Halomicroarcula sp. S1AR25-4]
MPKRLLKPVKTGWKQSKQIAGGIRDLLSWEFVSDLVPDWLLRITVEAVPKALYGDTPEDQIEGSVILIGWTIGTSLIWGWFTVAFVLFWGAFLTIGILRFSDIGSGAWEKTTSLLSPSLPGRGGDGSYGRRRGR